MPNTLPILFAAVLCAPCSLVAQTSYISPSGFANVEGPVAEEEALGAIPGRYMQIHSDFVGRPMTIHGMTLRVDHFTALRSMVAQLKDYELYMGQGTGTISATFSANYVGTATLVNNSLTYSAYNSPYPHYYGYMEYDAAPKLYGGSSLFFSRPYVHSGKGPLVWELRKRGGISGPSPHDGFDDTQRFLHIGSNFSSAGSTICPGATPTTCMDFLPHYLLDIAGARLELGGTMYRTVGTRYAHFMLGVPSNSPGPIWQNFGLVSPLLIAPSAGLTKWVLPYQPWMTGLQISVQGFGQTSYGPGSQPYYWFATRAKTFTILPAHPLSPVHSVRENNSANAASGVVRRAGLIVRFG
jgi:hypothetical protein